MKSATIALLAASFSLVGLGAARAALRGSGGAAFPQDGLKVPLGSLYSHMAEVTYDLSLAVDAQGDPRSNESVTEIRTAQAVPVFYGDVFAVTQKEDISILWYRASDGTVRNVAVDGAAERLYQFEKRDSARVTTEAQR